MKKREKKRLIVVLVLTALIFVFMGVSYSLTSAGRANPLSSAAQFIFSPVQSVFSKAGRSVGGFFEALSNVYTYREENERLKTEIDVLKQETRSIESLKQENERLRELLNFKETSTEYDMVGCEVIAKDAGNWFGTFKVDKGTSSGNQKDDVAVLRRALVGKVTEVGDNWAEITSIIEPESSVGALVTRTQDIAIAEGDLGLKDKGKLKLSFIADSAGLVAGDSIETSGIGGVYPKGLLIGTVSEIFTDSANNTNFAVVDTEVDFERIREVMVIKSKQ